ncbi:MAG: peptidoglycan-associated lipoprotein Pal [Elusimicrobia bacterium]|nr:peptidoglycan-associated lipoprotein Pal [Elusimicrobiota bacterium]
MITKQRLLAVAVVGMSIGLVGCPKKAMVKPAEKVSPVRASKEVKEEPSLRGKDYQSSPKVATAYFDFDKADIRSDAKPILTQNADYLKDHAELEVLVEGHCDERGTVAYNLGLGQRRAQAVRQYYASLGVSASRVATISYGKERPVCTESNENCWQQNRRAETKVRSTAKSR